MKQKSVWSQDFRNHTACKLVPLPTGTAVPRRDLPTGSFESRRFPPRWPARRKGALRQEVREFSANKPPNGAIAPRMGVDDGSPRFSNTLVAQILNKTGYVSFRASTIATRSAFPVDPLLFAAGAKWRASDHDLEDRVRLPSAVGLKFRCKFTKAHHLRLPWRRARSAPCPSSITNSLKCECCRRVRSSCGTSRRTRLARCVEIPYGRRDGVVMGIDQVTASSLMPGQGGNCRTLLLFCMACR